MDIEIGRHSSVDGIEEAAGTRWRGGACSSAGATPAGGNIEGGEQRRRAMALVIMIAPLGLAG